MGAALPHFHDIQAPIRMTIDEMDLPSMSHSESDPEYSAEEPSSASSSSEAENEMFYTPVAKQKKKHPAFRAAGVACIGLFVSLFALVLGLVLVTIFAVGSGSMGKGATVGWTIVAFLLIHLFLAAIFFAFRNKGRLYFFGVFLLISFVSFFVVTQVAISFVLPTSSMVANGMGEISLGNSNINLFSESGLALQKQFGCNYTHTLHEAKAFFGCALLNTEVNVYMGGLPTHFKNAPAMTIQNNIFVEKIVDKNSCLNTATIVHELTHVWQFKKGLWTVPSFFSWAQQQAQNRTGMYNYGGEAGLDDFSKAGKTILDFNFEQQAAIVEDYYNSKTRFFPDKYKQLLQKFADNILQC